MSLLACPTLPAASITCSVRVCLPSGLMAAVSTLPLKPSWGHGDARVESHAFACSRTSAPSTRKLAWLIPEPSLASKAMDCVERIHAFEDQAPPRPLLMVGATSSRKWTATSRRRMPFATGPGCEHGLKPHCTCRNSRVAFTGYEKRTG